MTRRVAHLGLLTLLVAASASQANVVALKRSPGLADARGFDGTLAAAITGGTATVITGAGVTADADLWTDTGWAASNCYNNTGIKTYASRTFLIKFNLSSLTGLAGGKINKAELRFYTAGGNGGMSHTGYVTFSDWAEGNKGGEYGAPPGQAPAAPGVSGAHPAGLNTGAYQDASGVSQPGFPASWANGQMFGPAKDGVTVVTGLALNPWGVTPGQWDQYLTVNVTPIVQVWADGAPNYGFFIDSVGNYSPHLSETATAEWQPVLMIDYSPNGPPNAVTDLAIVGKDWFKLDLQWTAPADSPPGPVARYDIRMSTSPITDDASFAAATALTAPTPAAPGTVQTLSVTGLTPSTTYYFAIKCYDATNLVSPLSNLPSDGTLAMDVTPPAAIALTAPSVKPNYVTLAWTAVGDDGMTGNAAGYEMRYSTSPITDDASFAAATAVAGLASPRSSGSAESFTVHGLMPSTTYYFAMKACDEVPNWSSLSNVVSFTTLAEDLLPPLTIADLHVQTTGIHVVCLAWTAPADQGSAGTAAYDLRYSTAPINDGNWAAATPVTGVQAPAAPGAPDSFIVSGLAPSTTYYFAIKTADYAEPANVSALSNVVSGTTMPPIVPVTVHNPWISNDRVADTHNITTMGATYVNAYTPDGVIAPANNEAKAINIYNNQKRRLYHWADEPPSVGGNDINDPTYNQNVFGWSLCGRHASQACTIASTAGLGQRKTAVPGDWQYELNYDGRWHLFHTMMTFYVYTRDVPPHVASSDEIKADNSLVLNAAAEGRGCPGLFLCGDTPAWEADAVNHYSDGGSGLVTTRWNGNVDIRLGQSLKRTWEAWQNQHPTPNTNADSMPGNDPPYHHECQNDWKDYVNYPYWEPYGAILPYIHTTKATYRRWSNGTDTLAPDFRSAGYQSMLEAGSHDLASYNDDALSPDLHCNAVNTTAEAIFKISVPFYITDAGFSGDFVKATGSDVCKVYVSSNGTSWTQVYDAPVGTTHVANLPLRTNVFGLWQTWYIKLQLKGAAARTDAGVSNFVVTTTFEHNKGALPYLDKGINHLTVTFDNAAELQASRNILHVVYKWKEYDGAAWTIDRSYDGYFAASPSTFTINVAGSKVPRTEYVLVEVIEPIIDLVPPAAVTDLAIGGAAGAARVPLTWTATGDDGSTGTAMAYDLRCSTSPITDDASFNAATQVTGVPSPKVAGSTETFVVMGLTPMTTYYFAIKAIDKGNNRSPMSNMTAPVMTTALLPVGDLVAGTPTCSVIPLTWTAIDDGSVGKETSYDLRCSTSPITEANFASATQVTGVPSPKAAGQAESFTVKGLLGSTTYYFAIKGVDAFGHASPISNIASATTAVTPHVSDLAATPGSNKVYLTWTAISDGNTGKMTSYNLRYSTSAIVDDATFDAAAAATGVPAPKTAGSAESFTVTGLAASTVYYFAIKGVDSFGHASLLSNIQTVTTTPADIVAPNWVGNLVGRPSGTGGGVDLTWSAPADFGYDGSGPFTCVSYELRYSASPIAWDDGGASWDAATAVSGLAAPKAPGSAETFTVSGLVGGTTYYFAVKAKDDSNNVSEVSNSAPAVASVLGNKVLQNGLGGYSGCLDTYIDMTNTNWGTMERMTICGYGPGNYQRGMVRFNVSSIPAGTVIAKATLSLFSYNDSQRKGSTGFYGAYKLTTDWTYNQCNWTIARTGVSWTTPGGDILVDPDGTAAKQGVAQVWYNFDVTPRVQAWINNGADNYGWMIKCTDEALSNQDWLYQSDTGTTDKRPKLVVSDLLPPVPGDISGDSSVDVEDLLYFVDSFGALCGTDRNYNPLCDFNSDGIVDVIDLLTFVQEYWPQ